MTATTGAMSSDVGTLVVVVGPTGSGKTDFAVDLALRLDAPIISTDSRQVFRGMAIGTAQPSAAQLGAVKHYFIADRDVTVEYNAGIFETEALALLEMLFRSRRYVVAAGGSGLYVDALCNGFDDLPRADHALRAELEQVLRREGLEPLREELRLRDPEYYCRVDRSNHVRILRALEVCRLSGRPYSELRGGVRAQRPFRIVKIGIDMPREELYSRIDRRVGAMLDAGLVAEVESLLPYRDLNALRTVGYREMFEYIDGKVSLDEAADNIRRNTRHYAKRQLTWFRRDPEIVWVRPGNKKSLEFLNEKFAE